LTSINVDNQNSIYASIDGVLFDKNIRTIIAYPTGKIEISYAIPSSVTSIGKYAFYGCYLTSITIPSSVTSIGESSLLGELLTSINVDNQNSVYASIDGVLFDKNIRTLISYPLGRNQKIYVIPSSVTSIGSGAFIHCGYLTNITIPSSVTSIGDWAFSECYSLTNVTIPSSVTSIGDYAFAYCDNLTSVTLSRRTQVGDYAFPESTRITYRD